MVLILRVRARHLFRQYRIMLRALAHPGVPWYTKVVCGLSALYVVSPIQLIPNFIPVIGQLDDVLVIGLSIKLLKRNVPPSVLRECQKATRSRRKSQRAELPLPYPAAQDAEAARRDPVDAMPS